MQLTSRLFVSYFRGRFNYFMNWENVFDSKIKIVLFITVSEPLLATDLQFHLAWRHEQWIGRELLAGDVP